MFARKLVVLAVLLMGVAPAYGAFEAHLYLGDESGNPLPASWAEGSPIVVTVWNDQSYNATSPGDRLTQIQLDWTASHRSDNGGGFDTYLMTPGTSNWLWSVTVDDGQVSHWDNYARLAAGADDSLDGDGFVMRRGRLDSEMVGGLPKDIIEQLHPLPDDEPFAVGTLTFAAPAYNDGGINEYVLNLTGGDHYSGVCTLMADGDTFIINAPEYGLDNLLLSDYTFTVTPEPATMALLAMGGAAMLIRRKR